VEAFQRGNHSVWGC